MRDIHNLSPRPWLHVNTPNVQTVATFENWLYYLVIKYISYNITILCSNVSICIYVSMCLQTVDDKEHI